MHEGRFFLKFGLIAVFSFSNAFAKSLNKTISLMSYNAENLFDTVHDRGKVDWTYLPLEVKRKSKEAMEYCHGLRNGFYKKTCLELDWNRQALRKKIKSLAKVIRHYDRGRGPDILVLQEVENIRALKLLNEWGNLGYSTAVLVEGPDKRGIDVGILSRFPLARKPKLHYVDVNANLGAGGESKETRGVLQATFKIGDKVLTVFGNHWPSQANSDYNRVAAAKALYNAAKQVTDSPVVALGDFNTLKDDDPHSINSILLNPKRKYNFYDAKNRTSKKRGTHWYRGAWAHLDRIFFLKRSTRLGPNGACLHHHCVRPLWNTFVVHAPSFAVADREWEDPKTGEVWLFEDVPVRYNMATGEGFSDHLAVGIKIEI